MLLLMHVRYHVSWVTEANGNCTTTKALGTITLMRFNTYLIRVVPWGMCFQEFIRKGRYYFVAAEPQK